MTHEELAGLFSKVEAFKKMLDECEFVPRLIHQPNEICDWADQLANDLTKAAFWVSMQSGRLRERDLAPAPSETQMLSMARTTDE